MKTKITLTLAGILAIASLAQSQQNPQPQPQAVQPCQPAPKTPDIVNRQAAKQGTKWGSRFAAILAKKTGGNISPIDIPQPKPSVPKPCPVQPSTPAPPASAVSATAQR